MGSRLLIVAGLSFSASLSGSAALAIDLDTADSGATTPQLMAEAIADAASGVSVAAGSASSAINAPGGPHSSDPRSYGEFSMGLTTPGTLLPPANQNVNGDAAYAGGIGIDNGVCLSTGFLSDQEETISPGAGVGIEGPNNGEWNDPMNPYLVGEISTILNKPEDDDFAAAVFNGSSPPNSGDATVLEFDVTITSPGYLRVSFVFGSDEAPHYLNDPFNDSFAVLIDGENVATITKPGVGTPTTEPFTLQDVEPCLNIYRKNDLAPAPEFDTDQHEQDGEPYYDHEFGGFTTVLTRETRGVLAPGTYRVKVVIQDVADQDVDSAIFIPDNGLKAFSFLPGDFNLNGSVDGADFLILSANFGLTDATFEEGDADGSGTIDAADFAIWNASFGQSGGNKDLRADFDRDGAVSGSDFLIWMSNNGMAECASRSEGDANQDGKVDGDDYTIWSSEFGS